MKLWEYDFGLPKILNQKCLGGTPDSRSFMRESLELLLAAVILHEVESDCLGFVLISSPGKSAALGIWITSINFYANQRIDSFPSLA